MNHNSRTPLNTRKLILRLKRDTRLYINSVPRLPLLLLTLLILIIHITSRPRHSFQTATCACPVPTTSSIFQHLLRRSTFVAHARYLHSDSLVHIFRIVVLYRGHIRSASYPLFVPRKLATACPHVYPLPSSEFLVMAGKISAWSPHLSNASVVSPTTHCGKALSVRLVEWKAVSRDVKELLREDDGDGNFWRARDAHFEFSSAVARARNVSRMPSQHYAKPDPAVEEEWWVKDGVSIIAACKDRSETLLCALSSWLETDVQEIVLVDWSSSPHISSIIPDWIARSDRLKLVTVSGQREWVLSRAYNLAARVAAHSTLLKVDCDTRLAPDFLQAHPLARSAFYSGDWRPLRSEVTDLLHVNGLLYVYRDDFLAIGGYDERIVTYGWDDSDISERLSRIRRVQRLRYDKVQHITHNASLRVTHHNSLLPSDNPHAAAVEIQRNRLLLTRFNLPSWRATSLHTLWNVVPDHSVSAAKPHPSFHLVASAANEVTAASALVSDADALDVSKRSIRLILHRYGVQLLPKTLSLPFYKALIGKIAFPNHYAEVLVSLRGGCMSRLIAQAATQHACSATDDNDRGLHTGIVPPPHPYIGWRLQALWHYPDVECPCKFSSLFDAQDAELLSAWFDTLNPLPAPRPITAETPPVNISSMLASFNTNSKPKRISEELSRWMNRSRPIAEEKPVYRLMTSEFTCDINPSDVPELRRNSLRDIFRQISPTASVQEAVVASLSSEQRTVLDSDIFSEDKWTLLVGEQFADRVKEQFSSPQLQQMSVTWSVTGAASRLNYRLDRRAAMLSIAMRVAEREDADVSVENGVSKEMMEAILQLKKLVNVLFLGCRASASNFLEAYPELAVILAGIFSSKVCL